MKFIKLLLVLAFATGLSLNAQDKEWFGSVPGDPALKNQNTQNSISFQTQNYLCYQQSDTPTLLNLFNGNTWKTVKFDSATTYLQAMDEQNDSLLVLTNNYSTKNSYAWLYNGSQWKKISTLKCFNYNTLNGISCLKFYKNKIYAIFLNNHFNSSLIAYDLKTNTTTTIATFQQKALNDVYAFHDKLALSVRNNRLYVAGAYDSANHQAAQGYGYYDGSSFKTLNIFPTSPINYSLVKPLDNNLLLVQRFYNVTTNPVTTNRVFIVRNDSLINDITEDLHTKYFTQTALAYSRHSFLQVYLQNGLIHLFTQVQEQHYAFDPQIQRWHVVNESFWDGYSFFFKNKRYVFNTEAKLPYTLTSLGCLVLKPKSYLTGTAYADLDDNCTQTGSDALIAQQWITLEGTKETTATLSTKNGFYELPLEPDTYTFKPYDAAFSNSACSTGTIKIDSLKPYKQDVPHNFVAPYKTTGDVKIDLYTTLLRRGLNHGVTITFENQGKPDLTVQPRLTFDPRLQFVSSSGAYYYKDQHTILFDPVQVNKFNPKKIDLVFYLNPDSLAVGDSITWIATADSSNTELRYDNNIKKQEVNVSGPYDPNHITGSYEGLVNTSPRTINYLVECQNLGTDTAFNVTIVDTIPNGLDIYSIKLLSSSSNNVSAMIKGNVVSFKLNQLRLTPKTLSDAKSKGFLIFSINLKDNLKAGELIENKAGIYFDYEAEVATNTTAFELTKDIVTVKRPTLKTKAPFTAYPNPSSNRITLQTKPGQNISSIQFFTPTGQALVAETTNNTDFDISQWPSGLFLMVVTIDGQTYTCMGSKVGR